MIDEFKKYLKKDGKSLNTILVYSKIIEEFMVWYSSNYSESFQLLKRKDVIEFEHYLKNYKENNERTVKIKLSALLKFNKFLVNSNIQNKRVM